MKNEILKIKKSVETLTVKFGGFDDAACLEQAYHACDPHNPKRWTARAVRINGEQIETGRIDWDFDDDFEDASDYPWETEGYFTKDNWLDLTDNDDLESISEIINEALRG